MRGSLPKIKTLNFHAVSLNEFKWVPLQNCDQPKTKGRGVGAACPGADSRRHAVCREFNTVILTKSHFILLDHHVPAILNNISDKYSTQNKQANKKPLLVGSSKQLLAGDTVLLIHMSASIWCTSLFIP